MRKGISIFITLFFVASKIYATEQENSERHYEDIKINQDDNKSVNGQVKESIMIDGSIQEIYKRMHIGILIYMDWIQQSGHKDPSSFDRVTHCRTGDDFKTNNNNAFRVTRAYLDVRYNISEILTARLCSDADTSVTPEGDSDSAFHLFLKFAYIEAKKDFGPAWVSVAGGLVETAVIGRIYRLSDTRWIDKNYIDQSKNIISQSIDCPADFGLNASVGILKLLTLSASYTNGSGYRRDETNSFKAIAYMMTLNPIDDFYLIGFGRNEITEKYDITDKKAKKEYYGYGIAYSSRLLKLGLTHLFPFITTVNAASYYNPGLPELYTGPTHRNSYMIVEGFLNFNLGEMVPALPLVLVARYVYGTQHRLCGKKMTDSEYRKERTSLLYALGIGWRFNKNVRIIIGGELQRYIIKKNKLLRYAETGGTDYLTDATDSYYVGSHIPRDTKRVYVKAELAI